MYDLRIYFMLFVLYSICGWIIEIIDIFIITKKVVDRGFLIGPYCPIYGCGAVAMTVFLNKYLSDPIGLFIIAMFICSVLEYITSYLMEKIFKARWWDYSNDKFNLNGRISLKTTVLFGLGGLVIMYITNPIFLKILTFIPNTLLTILTIVVGLIFLADFIISFNIILNFKKTASNIRKDSTEEITKMVKNILANKSIFTKRLVKAFPNVQAIQVKIDKVKKGKLINEKLSKRTRENNI